MNEKSQIKQSDVVTTITSVTFISLTIALMVFLKNRSLPLDNLKYALFALMLIAILLFAFSAFKSYVDISIASYGEVKEVLNIKLFSYFGGFIFIAISIIISLFI
jgi:hypothetical protein